MQACLSSFKLSDSKCSHMTSTHVSMHPSESSLNSFGFLKVFLDLPPPFSHESLFLVANASNVLFIVSQVLAYVMASGPTLLLVVKSPGPFVVFEVPLFIIVLPPPPPWSYDSRLFRCGSTKSTLLPCVRSVTGLSCDVEFLKMASNLACMAHELSAWSLLIVSILVSRLPNLLFTVSYRCFFSCMSFLMFFSLSHCR